MEIQGALTIELFATLYLPKTLHFNGAESLQDRLYWVSTAKSNLVSQPVITHSAQSVVQLVWRLAY